MSSQANQTPEERIAQLESEVQVLRLDVANLHTRLFDAEKVLAQLPTMDELPGLVVKWINEHSDRVYG